MDDMFKSGFVTIIGRPNVGKSTLMNKLVGEKYSIISNKPQTTRNTIQTILTKENCQIIFLDTPGIHKPKHQLGEYMVKVAEDTLNQVDLVLFMINPDGEVSTGDKFILDQFKNLKTPVILVINKIDTVDKERIFKTIESFNKMYQFIETVPVSALSGENSDELLKVIIDKLPEGPKYFPDDMVTDQPEKFIIAEIIREKVLQLLEQEVPHGTAVEIIQMREQQTNKDIMNISAVIYCEKETHKGIIIGKSGLMLKKIGSLARGDIEKLMGTKVFLELWVKVKKDWRDNPLSLKNFGYK